MERAKQAWDPDQYSEEAGFVPAFGKAVVDLLHPRSGERILDLGCGDGVLTERIRDFGAEIIGIDTSANMVKAAKERGLDARVGSGEDIDFENEFDAVFSNAALHWMTRPDSVLAGVWRALKPGGRFVGELGGQGNVETIVGALEGALRERGIDPAKHNPWFFPDERDYRERLERHGFDVSTTALFSRPTELPRDVTGWLETFGQSFVQAMPEPDRAHFLSEVADRCRPALCDEAGRWTADYVRLRFAAFKPVR